MNLHRSNGPSTCFDDPADLRALGWLDTWDFGGEREELDALTSEYKYEHATPFALKSLARRLSSLIRLRNVPLNYPVPRVVGCYIVDEDVSFVYLP